MKKEISPWARIKREAPGVQQSYREKKKSRKWLIALAGVLAVALLLSVLRIPERLLQFGEPNTEVSVPAMNLTGVYNSLLAEILEMEQEADWDGDGLRNGADPYPRDIDADRNGISDGYEGKSIHYRFKNKNGGFNMRKGENIFKRKDGRWEGRYIKGYELSGKAKYGFCYGKTYKEAKDKVSKCKAAIASGNPAQQSRSHRRFAFYCDEWLRFRKTKIKESTYVKYDAILEKHIKPKLGDCLPLGITTGLIDDFSKELLFESELSAKTVHDILVMLHSIIVHGG